MKCVVCGTENNTQLTKKDGWCISCGSPLRWATDNGRYVPNSIALWKRLSFGLVVALIAGYIVFGYLKGTIWLPVGNRHDYAIFEFNENGIYVAIGWLLLSITYVSISLIDHYDKRPNEYKYGKVLRTLELALVFSLTIVALVFGHNIGNIG